MIVSELIDKLKTLPQNAPVVFPGKTDGSVWELWPVTIVQATKPANNDNVSEKKKADFKPQVILH